jgi:hypothetical protein
MCFRLWCAWATPLQLLNFVDLNVSSFLLVHSVRRRQNDLGIVVLIAGSRGVANKKSLTLLGGVGGRAPASDNREIG